MGNSASSLGNSRQAEHTDQPHTTTVSQDGRAPGPSAGTRDRAGSSGSLPRKRNRFSSFRNAFTRDGYGSVTAQSSRSENAISADDQRRQRHRSVPLRQRVNRSQVPQSFRSREPSQSTERLPATSTVPLPEALEDVQMHDTRHEAEGTIRNEATTTSVRITNENGEADSNARLNILLGAAIPDEEGQPTPSNTDLPGESAVEIELDSTEHRATGESDAGQNVPSVVEQNDSRSEDISEARGAVNSVDDQASVLARLLSVAAAATAASLIGSHNRSALRDAQEVTNNSDQVTHSPNTDALSDLPRREDPEYVDGSFDSFLTALQNGRLAQALRAGNRPTERESAEQESLNFFRMFRFATGNNAEQTSNIESVPGIRMIPIIIVGIRSVPLAGHIGQNLETIPPFFGALQRMDRDNTSAPRMDTGPQVSSSDNNLDAFTEPRLPPDTNLEQDNRPHETPGVRQSRAGPSGMVTPSSATGYQSGMEHIATQDSTPRFDSAGTSVSARPQTMMDSVLDRLRSLRPDTAGSNSDTPPTGRRRGYRTPWRPFASTESPEPSNEHPMPATSSSFLVYVLGGTYPENHPILTTPSLFTDSPSYEDMLLLTSLIGPATPLTADVADLDSAGPTFEVVDSSEVLNSRCQVCLCEYELGACCRRLINCGHHFHKDCIDEWLTTGRNNCPMCRADTAARTKRVTEAPIDPAETTDMTSHAPITANSDSSDIS